MKNYIIFLLFTAFASISAQEISENEVDQSFNGIYCAIQDENWQLVYDQVIPLEQKIKDIKDFDTRYELLNFIHLISLSALMNEGKMSKEEVLEKANQKLNAGIIMPPVTYLNKCGTNCITISDDNPNTFMSVFNNLEGTKIYAFNYVEIATEINESKETLQGKNISTRARLDEVILEGEMFPRLKLMMKDGEYRVQ